MHRKKSSEIFYYYFDFNRDFMLLVERNDHKIK